MYNHFLFKAEFNCFVCCFVYDLFHGFMISYNSLRRSRQTDKPVADKYDKRSSPSLRAIVEKGYTKWYAQNGTIKPSTFTFWMSRELGLIPERKHSLPWQNSSGFFISSLPASADRAVVLVCSFSAIAY